MTPTRLYKFRPLLSSHQYNRVETIIQNGFHCCSFLDFNDVNEGVFPITEETNNIELTDKLKCKICSFSARSALSSQLMWGHYAEAGMGVAIEIKTPSPSPFEQVHYSINNRHDSLLKILTNKSDQWEHEAEWRYITTKLGEYYRAKITKIYFGTPYQSLHNYEEIKTKHRNLQKYLKKAEALKEECDIREIPYENYILT